MTDGDYGEPGSGEREIWVEMRVPPEWSRVDTVRAVTEGLVRAVGPTAADDLAERLAIVAGELMENAVKYGKAGELVAFQLHRDGQAIVLSVTSVADPATSSSARLKARVEWLATFDTALAAYHATIERLDSDAAAVDGAGLGLARILFEGECRLTCELREDGRVSMQARREWPAEELRAA
jgi:hypothetical protein